MSFDSIVGQPVIAESLRNAVAGRMVANGYLFCGPKGCGKKHTAFVFAQALNCKAAPSMRPCGQCSTCMRVKNSNHPNIEYIRPTGQSIKIKQIRQLISEVSKKPYEEGYKVIVVEEAEKMTHDAQDAFLKTLEEPPQNTVFLLLAENQYAILPTILSRCQVFQFKPVDSRAIEAYLAKAFSYPETKIKLASKYANGIIGRAVEILEGEQCFEARDFHIRLLDAAIKGHGQEACGMATEKILDRAEAEGFLAFALEWLRDLLVYRETGSLREQYLVNTDKADMLSSHDEALTDGKIISIMEIIKNTLNYMRFNVSIKNSMDSMLLNIAEVCLNNGKNSGRPV